MVGIIFVRFFLVIVSFVMFECNVFGQEEYIYGNISYYGEEFANRKTSSGVIFDPNKYTCASRTLPFGTILEVMNTKNGKTVVVMVNDRGPFVEGRILDISKRAAQDLDMIKDGVIFARIKIVRLGSGVFSEDEYSKMIGEYYSFDTKKAYEFAVQVGAFTNRILAQNMLERLKRDGFNNSYITEKVVGNIIFNRVRVGDYSDKDTAVKIRDTLKQKGYDTYFVSTYVEK
ncbi:MAG: septal ring lytic transglycosylase RlpA family protein [Brevinematales bacterium]|nr:septal ring lytic transglycosylase RlpA family protein [Brevinematales bacterium]